MYGWPYDTTARITAPNSVPEDVYIMKTINITIRLTVAVLCLLLTLTLTQLSVFAESAVNTAPDYLALGDSISTGYGLAAPEEEGFVSIVANRLGCSLTNTALNGCTADDILFILGLGILDQNIADAELITITCGGNDLMGALYSAIAAAYNAENGTTYTDNDVITAFAGTHATLTPYTFMITALDTIETFTETPEFNEALENYNENMNGENGIISYIRNINKDAVIIISTQYNPYAFFTDGYAAINAGIDAGAVMLNDVITSAAFDSTYAVADSYAAFRASEVNLCNAVTVPLNLDFHPNADGHAVIAETVISAVSANCPHNNVVDCICTLCGGNAHTPTQTVSDELKLSDADCTNAATYSVSCSVCGQPLDETFTDGEAVGHSYTDGSCTVCGEADPDFVTDNPQTGSADTVFVVMLTLSAATVFVISRRRSY